MIVARFLGWIVSSFVLVSSIASPTHAQERVSYEPGVLIVRYADIVADSVSRIMDSGGFSTALADAPIDVETGVRPGSTLDALHTTIGLHSVESAFLDRTEATTAEAKAQQQAYYAAIFDRFPERTAGRDSNATFPDRTNTYVLRVSPTTDIVALAEAYAADPAVLWAEPNYALELLQSCPPPRSLPNCDYFNDPLTLNEPFLYTCESHSIPGLEDAFDRFDTEAFTALCSATGSGVIVAVIDSGANYENPDLAPNLWFNEHPENPSLTEDINNSRTFEPWANSITCGICAANEEGEPGVGYRTRCDTNADCNPPSLYCPGAGSGSTCTLPDYCLCVAGDFDGIDNDSNDYIDDVIGYDFNTPGPNPFDALSVFGQYAGGHGTGVASIALAAANNLGMIGYAPDAELMVLKVKPVPNWGLEAVSAIDYAVANGANVTNMSWKVELYMAEISASLDAAYAAGVIQVAASGNSGAPGVAFPAKHERVIAVGWNTPEPGAERSDCSSYGPDLDVVAPAGPQGTCPELALIATTWSGSSTCPSCPRFSYPGEAIVHFVTAGTSNTSPQVAGLVALLKSRQTNLTNDMIVHAVTGTADDLANSGPDNEVGWGRINARRAMSLFLPATLSAAPAMPTLPVRIETTGQPYSRIDKGGSPADTIEHKGRFHNPSWDIDPVGASVTVRVTGKDENTLLEGTIPPTHADCSNPGNVCFKQTSNPLKYVYQNLSGPSAFNSLKKIKLAEYDASANRWKLIIKSKNMNDSIPPLNNGLDDLVDSDPGDLIWHLEIFDDPAWKPTLRSSNVFTKSTDGRKLTYP